MTRLQTSAPVRVPTRDWPALSAVLVTVLAWSSAFVAIRWADAPAGATAGVVYLGVVPTAVAFSTWAYALARMDAGRLGVTTYLVAPLTIVMAWVLLGEVPPQVERCYARQV